MFEELGRVLASVPLLGHLPATLLLDRGGDAEVVAALAAGEARAALVPARPPGDVETAWTRRARARADARARALLRRRHRDRDRQLGAGRARAPTTSSSSLDDGRAAHVRAADAAIEPATIYDATRSLGHVTLDGAPATLLDLGDGDTAAAWFLAQTLIAAEAVGAIDVALATSVAYAKERHTFGRAIGSYQAVKHELVEMLRGLDNARSLMYYAGWAAAGPAGGVRARGVRVPARGRQGVRPRRARADLRARRHRRDVGARRAALLPPRAAAPAPARRDRRRGRPRGGRAAGPGQGGGGRLAPGHPP